MVEVTPKMIETGVREIMDRYPESDIVDVQRRVVAAFWKIWPHFSDGYDA